MKTRIGILGLGGVGGFIGAKLAMHYTGKGETEVIFIVRPATEEIIKKNGFKLISGDEELKIFPDLVSAEPSVIGELDVLICCTKTYDIESALRALRPCIKKGSIILPLLNGVDSTEKIKAIFPEACVAEACIYIVSRIQEPGIVKVGSATHSIYFGSESIPVSRFEKLQGIFQEAGFNSILSADINKHIWEKFIFISAIATLTSYLDKTMGEIMADPGSKDMMKQLLREFLSVSAAHGISFDEDIFERTLLKMEKLPFDATSSMHNDFKKGGRSEYRSLTAYVAGLGDAYKIETPAYDLILETFKKKDMSAMNG